MRLTRRALFAAGAAALPAFVPWRRPAVKSPRVMAFMIDGFDPRYLDPALMPTLARWRREGVDRTVLGVMPSVTNANNATINTGMWPAAHGITGNSFLAPDGSERYMESAELLLVPTLFERMAERGIRGALLSSKKKTLGFLRRGAVLAATPEEPDAAMIARYGPPPPIYSGEVNHYTLRMAIDLLRTRPELGLLYVHTTDYPMHMWAPGDPRSDAHLRGLDAALAELADAAPDATICLTADHGMNAKTRVWDLVRACEARGTRIRAALATGRDKYLAHHAGHSGSSFVYLHDPSDHDRVRATLAGLEGVELVLARAEAAARFRLHPDRIGDFFVSGDPDTVFGVLDRERDQLPAGYRNHGSLHEQRVPLIITRPPRSVPPADWFRDSRDMLRWMWEAPPA